MVVVDVLRCFGMVREKIGFDGVIVIIVVVIVPSFSTIKHIGERERERRDRQLGINLPLSFRFVSLSL